MNEPSNDEARIRRFLLEDLDEEERERVEELFLTDSDTRDALLLAEDELIEEYLDGSLQGVDREKFRKVFVATPQLRRKVRIARSLSNLTRAEHSPQPTLVPSPTQDQGSFFSKMLKYRGRGNLLAYASAAAMLIVLTVGVFWYAEFRREQNRRLTVERELAALNDPLRRPELPADQVLPLVLSPVSVRSSGSRIRLPATDAYLELSLLPEIARAETYNVLIQRVGLGDEFAVPNLRLEDQPAGKVIRVRIPTRLLNPGLYRLRLHGVMLDGRAVETNEFSFEVFR